MMLTELLATLRDLNVRLYVEGGELKCKAPRNVLTDEIKTHLKARKNELIDAFSYAGKYNEISISPAPRTDSIPLSYAQQRLWFLDQLAPNNAFYNVPLALRLNGKLNAAALEQSLDEIIRRHQSLRTKFVSVNGQAEQVITEQFKFPIAYVDLTGVPEQSRPAALLDLSCLEAEKPFDLSTEPLLRALLIELLNDSNKQEHILLITLHHIVSDGWSSEILTRELVALYQAFSEGKVSPLSELAIQYADFAYWQRQRLVGDVLQRQIDYWQKQLRAAPAVLELPTDHPRPPVMNYCGASYSFSIPPELAKQVYALNRSHDTTLFMTLLAAFNVLLCRYSHQQDLCIGTPIANRNRLEIEGLIGFFVNTLVLRADLSGEPSFKELLGQVRRTVLDAQSHQDLPFEQLVEVLQPERNMSYSPLFQVMFTLQNTVRHSLELSGLDISAVEKESSIAKFDLTLHIQEESGLLNGMIEYNTGLFEHDTIARLAEHYLILLQGIVDRPDRRLSELPLLTQAERQQILIEFNATAVVYPHEYLIQQLFERQVENTPDAVAVVFEDESLSYNDLNRRANRVAHHLLGLGIRPDDRVAICVERGLDMVVGLLGILKSGAAYIPLDPSYPDERLAYMLSDSEPAVLLTQSTLQKSLTSLAVPVVLLDALAMFAEQPDDNPDPIVLGLTSSHLAYIIYTSGSTGQPKGVMVEHANVVNFLCAMSKAPGITYSDSLLAVSTLSFDIAGLEMFLPLINGAKIVLISRVNAADPVFLQQTIAQAGITIMQATPATWRLLLNGGWQGSSGLKALCGGEALAIELSARLIESVGELWNLYGPTETTIWSTCRLIDARGAELYPYESVGQPIGNTQIYILDAQLQPVPQGVSGEVYIGGAGVARGYLNQPGLTSERFISDPFSMNTESNARLYKTGDLGRWLPDGNIEYIGRNDFQVKIRGFRIELGEIEARLAACIGIREAVVIVREDNPGDKRLVAYLIAHNGVELVVADLRVQLTTVLADYMIPSAFVSLSDFPLTPNGKLDRKALPAPNFCEQSHKHYVAPRTTTEEMLAAIWIEVLGIEKIGVHDNFFESGGHSLLAVQVISRAISVFDADLSIKSLFELPTIAELAHELDVNLTSAATILPIEPVARQQAIPLSYAQQRLWFLDQFVQNNAFYNMPVALRLNGNLNAAALEQSLNEIIRRHESLRTTFVNVNGQAEQVIAAQFALPIVYMDLTGLPEQARSATLLSLSRLEAEKLFVLSTGPLLRVLLINLFNEADRQEHILLITLHHIISDGWSSEVLTREFVALYQVFSEGRISPLAELVIQYADFAYWQRQWLVGDVLQQQIDYWQKQLEGTPDLHELPTDRTRPTIMSYCGANYCFTVPRALSEKLHILSRRYSVTLFMALLAAFNVLLFRYSHQKDLSIGTPIANRNRLEIEGLIGFFVNTLVLRTDLSANPSFKELLSQVRRTVLDAQSHQDLPFEQLVEVLQPKRNMSYSPLFQVLFVLQNTPKSSLKLSGLQINSMDEENATTKFDLTLFINERAGALECTFEYNIDLFDHSTISRLAEHYLILLQGIVDQPDTRLSELPLLTQKENQQTLFDWNDTTIDYPRVKYIPQLFEDRAAQMPNAAAVVFDDRSLSYCELNARANQLAHYLRTKGVGPDVLVGLCVERSLEMIVGLMGILKAGGAYVPLDPGYPQDRLDFMIADVNAPIVLTQAGLLNKLALCSTKILCLDTQWHEVAVEPATNPVVAIMPENLAYCIYTSGSTGQPKGVGVPHQGILNRLQWMQEQYGLNEMDRVLQKTPFSFDVSVWEFFWPLMTGACLFVAGPEQHKDSIAMMNMIVQHQISTLHFVPSMLQAFVDTSGIERCTSLKRVICSGEALPADVVRRFYEKSAAQLHNLYGPTEASVDVTAWFCMPDKTDDSIPIGRPIANISLYILDRQLNPVPVGALGELHIGGIGLARGYLNRPDLTAEKFIPNPFGAPGSRLYKTGDLTRYLSNGDIEYAGRIDHQVKIRGVRIELGEIESLLMQSPEVKEVVVLAREDIPGDKRLVTYVVPDRVNQNPDAEGFRSNISGEQVSQWQMLWELTYDKETVLEAGSNFAGWNSSYTGLSIPEDEMYEWLDNTVKRINRYQPHSVLEIGCGGGLLLFRVAPYCDRYVCSDFSLGALSYIQSQLDSFGQDMSHVQTLNQPANDFTAIAEKSFDTVVINSVVQYFPTADYLTEVLKGAIRSIIPGGRLFIGDVRNLALLYPFYIAVELQQALASMAITELKQRIYGYQAKEEELVIDPHFFLMLKAQIPEISYVEILPKRGRFRNEMSQFRYDVVLHIDTQTDDLGDLNWIDWKVEKLTLLDLRQILTERMPEIIAIKNIPNARVMHEVYAFELLDGMKSPQTVKDLQKSLVACQATGVDPEDLWDLSLELPYTIEISWANGSGNGSFDLVCLRNYSSTTKPLKWIVNESDDYKRRDAYANNPLQGRIHQDIKARLQGLLQEKLPSYMVPSHFAFLDALPLTASGKVDRKALPALDLSVQLQKQYVAPRTQTEEILTGIWAEILNVNRIGVHDNFFELGGNSLLAVTLAHTIQSVLGGNLDLIALFQAPTIEEFAKLLADEATAVSSPLVTLKSAGTRAPLYCIDPGGYVFEYKTLAQAMSHGQPVYGIDSRSLLLNPTRQYASFTDAAEYYVQAILKHQPEGPYYLLGWSMGGTIALIITQILESRGHEVAFVGLLDTRINSLAKADLNSDLLTRYTRYLNPAERQAFDQIDAATREEFQAFLLTLPVDEQLEQVILWATKQGCLHRNLPVALMKLQFIVAENSLRLMNAHQWGVIKAPLYAWWASDTLKRYEQIPEDWRLYTTGSVVNEEIEGNHMDIIKNPQLHSSLAEILKNSQTSS
ncbi:MULTISPECIES: amino acid adenylation domain-containing protein [Methylobacter]